MKPKFRCDCPITSALDVVGDKWMLVIVKLMLLEHRQTFKEFTESDEAIATNILSSKLKILEAFNLISKFKMPNNKKTNIYHLTDSGLSLAPVIVELALWSDAHLRLFNPIIQNGEAMEAMRNDKKAFAAMLVRKYEEMRDKNI